MDAKELKPCPFCGATPFLQRMDGIVGISCGHDSACNKTGLAIAFSPEKEASAIAAWNRRAALPSDAAHAPIYQHRDHEEHHVWHDVAKSVYDAADKELRRIVYAAPLPRSSDAAFEPPMRQPGETFCEWAKRAYASDAPAPDVALLCSMATCLNHGFGALPSDQQRAMLDDMRKLYDEVTGRGYYRPENRERYTQWLSSEIDGGARANVVVLDALTEKEINDAE